MDRFKFRTWRIKENCYNHQEHFPTCCMQENGLLAYFHEEKQMQNYIVEQCTGLKDKNGKLIYEGDILKSNDTILKVFWWSELGSFAFKKRKDVFTMSQQSIALCGFEVIGNIHENKDLLEDKCHI